MGVVISLGDVLTKVNRAEKIQSHKEYNILKILSGVNGAEHKETKMGSSIYSESLYRVEEGDFVVSLLNTHNRGVSIVPFEFSDYYISKTYQAFLLDAANILPDYLLAFFRWDESSKKIFTCLNKTGNGREHLNLLAFFSQKIYLPSLEEQAETVKAVSLFLDLNKELEQLKVSGVELMQHILDKNFFNC